MIHHSGSARPVNGATLDLLAPAHLPTDLKCVNELRELMEQRQATQLSLAEVIEL